MTEEKQCLECLSLIPEKANLCRFCGSRVNGAECPDCKSICNPEAVVCKWCGKKLKKAHRIKLTKTIEIESTFLGTLLSRMRLLPQKAIFSHDKIIISTPGLLGLTRNDEEVPWEKVAGFQHKNGIFWDTVWIETRGQTGPSIWGLRKDDATTIKNLLQSLEK